MSSSILPFAGVDTGSNLLTDAEYASDSQRLIGNQPGVARAKLVNKALKQGTLLAAAIAHFIAETRSISLDDTMTHEAIAAQLVLALNGMISGVAPPNGYETTGMIAYHPRSSPPLNWLRCNGAAVSRAAYANLFGVIGTLFGAGDGSTTFNLPDLRGEFIRGLDDGRGVDAGRSLGSWQKATLISVDSPSTGLATNTIRGTWAAVGGEGYDPNLYSGATAVFNHVPYEMSITQSPYEQMTTRPRNVAMLACIKF